MNNVTYLELDIDGTKVLVQAEQTLQVQQASSVGNVLEKVENAFDKAKEAITKVSANFSRTIREMKDDVRPNEVTIKLGIKFDVAGNVIIANTGIGASLDVEIKYKFE